MCVRDVYSDRYLPFSFCFFRGVARFLPFPALRRPVVPVVLNCALVGVVLVLIHHLFSSYMFSFFLLLGTYQVPGMMCSCIRTSIYIYVLFLVLMCFNCFFLFLIFVLLCFLFLIFCFRFDAFQLLFLVFDFCAVVFLLRISFLILCCCIVACFLFLVDVSVPVAILNPIELFCCCCIPIWYVLTGCLVLASVPGVILNRYRTLCLLYCCTYVRIDRVVAVLPGTATTAGRGAAPPPTPSGSRS